MFYGSVLTNNPLPFSGLQSSLGLFSTTIVSGIEHHFAKCVYTSSHIIKTQLAMTGHEDVISLQVIDEPKKLS